MPVVSLVVNPVEISLEVIPLVTPVEMGFDVTPVNPVVISVEMD